MADIIKSDLDSLERLASSFYDASHKQLDILLVYASQDQEIDTLNDIAKEIRLAVMDIQNLRDELIELEKLHANLERVGSWERIKTSSNLWGLIKL